MFILAFLVLAASMGGGVFASMLTAAPEADAAVHCFTEWNGFQWTRVCVIIPDWPDVYW